VTKIPNPILQKRKSVLASASIHPESPEEKTKPHKQPPDTCMFWRAPIPHSFDRQCDCVCLLIRRPVGESGRWCGEGVLLEPHLLGLRGGVEAPGPVRSDDVPCLWRGRYLRVLMGVKGGYLGGCTQLYSLHMRDGFISLLEDSIARCNEEDVSRNERLQKTDRMPRESFHHLRASLRCEITGELVPRRPKGYRPQDG
jgi:hypothetical protein